MTLTKIYQKQVWYRGHTVCCKVCFRRCLPCKNYESWWAADFKYKWCQKSWHIAAVCVPHNSKMQAKLALIHGEAHWGVMVIALPIIYSTNYHTPLERATCRHLLNRRSYDACIGSLAWLCILFGTSTHYKSVLFELLPFWCLLRTFFLQ